MLIEELICFCDIILIYKQITNAILNIIFKFIW